MAKNLHYYTFGNSHYNGIRKPGNGSEYDSGRAETFPNQKEDGDSCGYWSGWKSVEREERDIVEIKAVCNFVVSISLQTIVLSKSKRPGRRNKKDVRSWRERKNCRKACERPELKRNA